MSLPKQVGPRRTLEKRGRMNAKEYRIYLEKKMCKDMEVYYDGLSKEWDESFVLTAKSHNRLANNIAVEYVESWDKEETERIGKEKLFEIGIKNAKTLYPDNDVVVVPHINKNGCFHTHVLFCAVDNNGERIQSRFSERAKWHAVCDKSSRSNGLSTVTRTTSEQKEKLSSKAHQIKRRGGLPHQLQIMQKADLARRIATNIDEFVSLMGNLGINVNDRGKVITYFHPARTKGIRDRSLGELYKKENLVELFKRNKEEFDRRPNLRASLTRAANSLYDESGNLVGDSSHFPFHSGGHKRFEKSDAKEVGPTTKPKERDLLSGPEYSSVYSILNAHVSKARSRSIPEYCKNNGIALNQNQDGSYTLKGREKILIRGNRWENTETRRGNKVGTTGSLIELVANHKNLSLLESISEITGNKNLLLLEKHIGSQKRDYKEFHIPRQNQKDKEKSIFDIKRLVKKMGYKSDLAKWLYGTKKVQVGTKGTIRFLLGESGTGAVEFNEKKDGSWSKKLLGNLQKNFFSKSGGGKKLKVYSDPFAYMSETNGGNTGGLSVTDSVLVLGDGGQEALDFFLAKNGSIKEVELFGFKNKTLDHTRQMELSKCRIKFSFMDTNGKDRAREISIDLSR